MSKLPTQGLTDGLHALVFVDNHDNQRSGGALTYKDGYFYKLAAAFMVYIDSLFSSLYRGFNYLYSPLFVISWPKTMASSVSCHPTSLTIVTQAHPAASQTEAKATAEMVGSVNTGGIP